MTKTSLFAFLNFILPTVFLCSADAKEAPSSPLLVAQARDILGKSVSFRTVQGQGQVPAYAAYIANTLKAAGYADADIKIERHGETATLVARYPGDGSKRPMLVAGHMDVVEAIAKDWARDPFIMMSEKGYLFGRGVQDNKFDVTMIVTTLMRLKSEGFKPKRDIILVLSGDEELEGETTARLARQFPNAEFLLNGDAGGGRLSEDGKPIAYHIQAAEKTYADYDISFTNPGGHSSAPRKDNAIYDLARAAEKIAAYDFPVQVNELTRASLRATGEHTPGELGTAMKQLADNPADTKAAAVLSADPAYIGQIRTTCVATMLQGGHARNALPQSATLSVNCRIFPGVSIESIRDQLAKVIDNPRATISIVDHPLASDASPLRPDIMSAVRKAVSRQYPSLAVIPEMSAGASDSLFFRNAGIPSYGVSGLYMKASDDFAHGLNERVPENAIKGALDHWHVLLTELAH